MNFDTIRQRARNTAYLLGKAQDKLFLWLCSLLAVIGVPCVPIFLEWLKTGIVTSNTYFITSIVLNATYFFGTESWFYRFWYGALFGINCLLDGTPPSSPVHTVVDHGGALLIAVAVLHASERFGWHVFQDRPFPDTVRNPSHG